MEPLSSLEELTQALRCLPSVGPKAAQRMALHLLQHDREGAQRLALALEAATRAIRHCQRCNTFTEDEICTLCRSSKRDATLLCVRWRRTQAKTLMHALGLLHDAHAKVTATVLTRVDTREHLYSGNADAGVYHRRYKAYYPG